jgi:cytochrome c biogenesis protein CcdA
MNLEMMSIAFGAGVVTFFNPCGFALLPAYVSYYLSERNNPSSAVAGRWLKSSWKGLSLGLIVSAGFFTVFGALGLAFSLLGGSVMRLLGPNLPWVAATIGAALIVVGLLMLFSSFSFGLSLEKLAARFTGNPAPRAGSLPYFLYGIGYAVGSVGCTLPIFLIWVVQPLLQGFVGGLLNFFAYASGMALMMIALSLMMSFSKGFIERYLSPLMKYVHKAAALVMIGAGAYLIYYNLIYSGVIGF